MNEYIIRLVGSSCKTNLHFSYDKLNNIPHNIIIEDLFQIFFVDNISNNFHLFLEKGHLKAIEFSKLQINNYINSSILTSINDKIKKNNDNNNTFNVKENKNEEINNMIEMANNSQILNMLSSPKDEKEKKLNAENANREMFDEKIKNHRNEFAYANEELTRINSELNLIELDKVIKYFINFIYFGLNLYGSQTYEDKVKSILELYDTFNSSIYNKDLIDSSKKCLNELIEKVNTGNYKDYYFDLEYSIIDQIFNFINKKGEHKDFLFKLKNETNAEKIIKDLCVNLELNFLNKNVMMTDLKKIDYKVNDLRKLFIKN